MLACESVGVAQRALDLVADYTKERQQFGRVIGTYQGVSHRVANTFVAGQTVTIANAVNIVGSTTISGENPISFAGVTTLVLNWAGVRLTAQLLKKVVGA